MRKWGLVFLFAVGIFGLGVEREALAREGLEQQSAQTEHEEDYEMVHQEPLPPNCPNNVTAYCQETYGNGVCMNRQRGGCTQVLCDPYAPTKGTYTSIPVDCQTGKQIVPGQ
jgi:hypothetical protein